MQAEGESGTLERASKVSIGMPVYNGAASVGKALDALLAQTFTDFELIISDNASTDGTWEVLQRYAARDKRIVLHRQSENIGPALNFHFLLQKARGEYFMWAACDDWWRPEFIERNVNVLDSDPSVVCSISKVTMEALKKRPEEWLSTYPITGSYLQRVRRYLANPGSNSRFYGLVRREAIAGYEPNTWTAADWATSVMLLKYGSFHEVPDVLMERSGDGMSKNLAPTYLRQFSWTKLATWFPLIDFTKWLHRDLDDKTFWLCSDLILRHNLVQCILLAGEAVRRALRLGQYRRGE